MSCLNSSRAACDPCLLAGTVSKVLLLFERGGRFCSSHVLGLLQLAFLAAAQASSDMTLRKWR